MILLSLLGASLFVFFTSTTTGLKTLIHLSAAYVHQRVHIKGLEGRLWDQSQVAELNYHYKGVQIKIKKARLIWTFNTLMHHELSINEFHADSVQIKQHGAVFLLNDVKLRAFINQHSATLNSLHFKYQEFNILGQLQAKTQYPYSFSTTIQLNPLEKNKPLTGALNAAGDLNLINWTGDFNGLGSVSIQGALSHLKQLEQTIKWHDLNWPNTKSVLSKEGSIKISGDLPQLHIEVNSKINRTPQDPWQINGAINGVLPSVWDFNINVLHSEGKAAKHDGIYTDFIITGALKNEQQGNASVKIAPGYYQMPQDSPIPLLPFKGGTITAKLSPEGLDGTGLLTLDENKKFNFNFNAPNFNLEQGLTKNQTFSSELTLVLNSLDFLSSLTPEIKNPKGVIMLSIKAKGMIQKPEIETKIELNNASVEVPALGLNLNAINATVLGVKDHWDGTAMLHSTNKTLNLKGHGLLVPQFTADIALEGTEVPVINTEEYQITASPRLQMQYKKNLLQITGAIQVPQAHIKIQSFSNSVSLSNDVVFANKKPNLSSPVHTQMNVQVEMGKQVELTAKGLHATLAGTVTVKQAPQSAMSATGELNVVQGEYKAYAQNLSIEQGELFFTGGAIDNPGINLRASKNIDTSSTSVASTNQSLDFNNNIQNANLRGNISVGVEVTGRLTEPDIQLFSTPAILSQADILSMLVLGRPASQANKAGGQLLLAAISSMNFGSGTKGLQLFEQLKNSLGIDFNVETNSNYNLLTNTVSDKTAFVVSKSISKRISIGYNVGLSQADPNVVTLKYLLNKFFSIQVNTSNTSSGIDVLYTSTKK
jgi:translocation and assembly module TamB